MKAYRVKTDRSDYPYLVLAKSITEVESKIKEKETKASIVEILSVELLEEYLLGNIII